MAKNALVPQSTKDVIHNDDKPSDFPNVGGSGQGGKPGYNQLVSEAVAEEAPRDLEGDANGPSVWGKGGTAFPVVKSSAEVGTSQSTRFGVDLVNGDISPNVITERT